MNEYTQFILTEDDEDDMSQVQASAPTAARTAAALAAACYLTLISVPGMGLLLASAVLLGSGRL